MLTFLPCTVLYVHYMYSFITALILAKLRKCNRLLSSTKQKNTLSTTVSVPSSELGSPPPSLLPQASVFPLEGVGRSQFGRLEKKPSTLSTLYSIWLLLIHRRTSLLHKMIWQIIFRCYKNIIWFLMVCFRLGFWGGFTTRGAQRGIKHAAKSALIPGNEIICVATKNQTSQANRPPLSVPLILCPIRNADKKLRLGFVINDHFRAVHYIYFIYIILHTAWKMP